MSKDHWKDLLRTRQFTTPNNIAHAVEFALGSAKITVTDARHIMLDLGMAEPADPTPSLSILMEPSPIAEDNSAAGKGKKTLSYPINVISGTPSERAWLRIIGIERKWFAYARSGYLNWSERGRERYAAAEPRAQDDPAPSQVPQGYVKPLQLNLF